MILSISHCQHKIWSLFFHAFTRKRISDVSARLKRHSNRQTDQRMNESERWWNSEFETFRVGQKNSWDFRVAQTENEQKLLNERPSDHPMRHRDIQGLLFLSESVNNSPCMQNVWIQWEKRSNPWKDMPIQDLIWWLRGLIILDPIHSSWGKFRSRGVRNGQNLNKTCSLCAISQSDG